MSDRDLLAFQRFMRIWDSSLERLPSVFLFSKFCELRATEHIVPHDAPITCNACFIQECYEYADQILQVVYESEHG